MTMLSLGQAAKLAGVGKTTISRAVHSGRLSAVRNGDGGYQIDPAELARVYDLDAARLEKRETPEASSVTGHAERDATLADRLKYQNEVRLLQAQVQALRDLMESEKARREQAEVDRDRWAKQAETVAALLPPPPMESPIAPVRVGLLKRLFGHKS